MEQRDRNAQGLPQSVGRAAEIAARHVEDLILEGSLRPGDRLLAERELALRLNVSRPTLRDCLELLEGRGLLVSLSGGGTKVAALGTSITDPLLALLASRVEIIDDYLEFRTVIENAAASLAAEHANAVDIDLLSACMERIDRAHARADPQEEAEADADLHIAIYEGTHNVVLLHIMRALSNMLRSDVSHNRDRLYSRPEIRDVLRDQHRAIVEAILARDPEAAGKAAHAHLSYLRRAVREIREAEAQLEMSLRRLDGGNIAARARSIDKTS